MRSRLLALLAGAAICLGTALVALPTATAETPPPVDQDFLPCSGPTDDYCVALSTADGTTTYPSTDPTDGAVPRDYPWVKIVDSHLMVFGVWRDVNGTGNILENDVTNGVTYKLVVRTGTFFPREMDGIVKNADYAIGTSPTGGNQFTLEFEPTPVHHYGIGPSGCSVDGFCVSASTKATWDVPGFATGAVEDLAVSGLDPTEIAQRTGMWTVSNAQDHYVFYDIDTNSLEVRLANPHLNAAGTPVSDGSFSAFIPYSYLIGTMNVPDPSTLTAGSFTVIRSLADGGSVTVPIGLVQDTVNGGIRIKIDPISFSKPRYNIKPKPRVPGKPRLTGVVKIPGAAKSYFKAPLANGGRAIDLYQAACRKSSTVPFKFRTGTRSPLTVTSLPPGQVYCQVRARNSVGWGPWGKAAASHT